MMSKEEERRFDQLADNEEISRREVTEQKITLEQQLSLIKELKRHAKYLEDLISHLVSKPVTHEEPDGHIHESWQGPNPSFSQRFPQ